MNKLYMLGIFNAHWGQTIFAYHLFCKIHKASGLIYIQFKDDLGKFSNKVKLGNCQTPLCGCLSFLANSVMSYMAIPANDTHDAKTDKW